MVKVFGLGKWLKKPEIIAQFVLICSWSWAVFYPRFLEVEKMR